MCMILIHLSTTTIYTNYSVINDNYDDDDHDFSIKEVLFKETVFSWV